MRGLGLGVDERDGSADVGVAERADPSALRIGVGVEPAPDRAQHEDVAEPGDDGLTARPWLARLSGDHRQERRHLLQCAARVGVDVDHLR